MGPRQIAVKALKGRINSPDRTPQSITLTTDATANRNARTCCVSGTPKASSIAAPVRKCAMIQNTDQCSE
ncbi:MAG: hypothetical protein U5R06_11915 [candidate division KSB1 bacterium]|nr:hypothetical protein [candidate division KSB1 bacterium]